MSGNIKVYGDNASGYQPERVTRRGVEISADIYFTRSEAWRAIRAKHVKWELVNPELESSNA